MILPTRHLTPEQSLLGVAAVVLSELHQTPRTVNELWEISRGNKYVGTFDRFVLALDLLFLMGCVDLAAGMLKVAA